MRPFSEMAGEMFAANWNDDAVAISFVTKDGPMRITFKEFREAHAARAALKRSHRDCQRDQDAQREEGRGDDLRQHDDKVEAQRSGLGRLRSTAAPGQSTRRAGRAFRYKPGREQTHCG